MGRSNNSKRTPRNPTPGEQRPVESRVSPVLSEAVQCHRAGDIQRARQLYEQVLHDSPNQPDALNLLGVVHMQTDQRTQAVELIGKALAIHPTNPDYHNNLGAVLKELGRLDEAERHFERALVLRPQYLDAHYNLAHTIQMLGRSEEALEHYEQALSLNPEFCEAHNNKGTVLQALGRLQESEASFRRALELNPDHSGAKANLEAARKTLSRATTTVESVTDRFARIVPVIVTAPTARNGVTLIQRLLNSTKQIIVYGENANLCEWFAAVVEDAIKIHKISSAEHNNSRRRFLKETTEYWSSNLWPDSEAYAELMVDTFKKTVCLYEECSLRYGFDRWGLKYPFNTVECFERLMRLLPQARYIYIYRNLFDVARSSKSRQFTRTEADYVGLATSWQDSIKRILTKREENCLIIRYESLIQSPEVEISRLEDFTSLPDIDRTVLQRKFNTFKGEASLGFAASEYIEPTELTDAERNALATTAAEALELTGYTDENRRKTQNPKPKAQMQENEGSASLLR